MLHNIRMVVVVGIEYYYVDYLVELYWLGVSLMRGLASYLKVTFIHFKLVQSSNGSSSN